MITKAAIIVAIIFVAVVVSIAATFCTAVLMLFMPGLVSSNFGAALDMAFKMNIATMFLYALGLAAYCIPQVRMRTKQGLDGLHQVFGICAIASLCLLPFIMLTLGAGHFSTIAGITSAVFCSTALVAIQVAVVKLLSMPIK